MLEGRRHARATLDYDRIRASLSAWMSYRAAADLLAMLLPVDSGDGIATFHKRTQAFGRSLLASPLPAERPVAKEISLALDTTYIRSNQPERGRQMGNSHRRGGIGGWGAPIFRRTDPRQSCQSRGD